MKEHNVTKIDSKKAWELLSHDPSAKLIDVRTTAEWNTVGIADLSQLNARPILIEWLSYPNMEPNPEFFTSLHEVTNKEDTVIFLCKAGGRSQAAAVAALEDGYAKVISVTDGFEGHPAEAGTGALGWKHNDLPWVLP